MAVALSARSAFPYSRMKKYIFSFSFDAQDFRMINFGIIDKWNFMWVTEVMVVVGQDRREGDVADQLTIDSVGILFMLAFLVEMVR